MTEQRCPYCKRHRGTSFRVGSAPLEFCWKGFASSPFVADPSRDCTDATIAHLRASASLAAEVVEAADRLRESFRGSWLDELPQAKAYDAARQKRSMGMAEDFLKPPTPLWPRVDQFMSDSDLTAAAERIKASCDWSRLPKLAAIFEHRPGVNRYWHELVALTLLSLGVNKTPTATPCAVCNGTGIDENLDQQKLDAAVAHCLQRADELDRAASEERAHLERAAELFFESLTDPVIDQGFLPPRYGAWLAAEKLRREKRGSE